MRIVLTIIVKTPPCPGCGQRWQNVQVDLEVGFYCCPICSEQIKVKETS